MAPKNLVKKFGRHKSKGVKRHAVKGQNVMLHMLYDIGAMGLLGHKLSENREAKNWTML